jgi:hypothetical protein
MIIIARRFIGGPGWRSIWKGKGRGLCFFTTIPMFLTRGGEGSGSGAKGRSCISHTAIEAAEIVLNHHRCEVWIALSEESRHRSFLRGWILSEVVMFLTCAPSAFEDAWAKLAKASLTRVRHEHLSE